MVTVGIRLDKRRSGAAAVARSVAKTGRTE
jgi:hypothetical protein